jgi:hypothetical protein
MMHDGIGAELKHSISCDVIHVRFRGGWRDTRVMWLADWGTMEGRQYKIETASNQSFFHPSNRADRLNESDSPSCLHHPWIPMVLRRPLVRPTLWYDIPFMVFFLALYNIFFVIVSFIVLLIYKTLSSLWFPRYYAERSREFFIISHGSRKKYKLLPCWVVLMSTPESIFF